MPARPSISVVITTRNRAELLPSALERVLNQKTASIDYEVVVVDNNSVDNTWDLIGTFQPHHPNLRRVREERTGISYGRNAGLAAASAPVIAFTDDDIRVPDTWLESIRCAFDEHPEVDYVGGKVIPEWKTEPPKWLTREHWWPVVLIDWGEVPFLVGAQNPVCLPTANAAFRKAVFETVGLFAPEFSGREDHELLVRLWQKGRVGLYDPRIVAFTEVQPDRLTKRYHRKWNFKTGQFNSMSRLDDQMGRDGKLHKVDFQGDQLIGVPLYIYRKLLTEIVLRIRGAISDPEHIARQHENHVCYLLGYISQRYRENLGALMRSVAKGARRFVGAIIGS